MTKAEVDVAMRVRRPLAFLIWKPKLPPLLITDKVLFMTSEEQIKHFLRPPSEGGIYTEASLVAALGHAESSRLSFFSCCCFAGIPSARHELRGEVKVGRGIISELYREGHDVPMIPDHKWLQASMAYVRLGETDEERRAKLIPLIKQEISRREALRAEVSETVMV